MRRTIAAGFAALLISTQASFAQTQIDITAYFQKARDLGHDGLARKTKIVDARDARPDEVVVTVIKGEGKETQSPPAKAGDMVVRNRCAETGERGVSCLRFEIRQPIRRAGRASGRGRLASVSAARRGYALRRRDG